MAASSRAEMLRASVVDRLCAKPGERPESQWFQGLDVRQLKAAVARDLAWLLNTRVWLPADAAELEGLEEARESILTYGIPDLSRFSWASPQDARTIAGLVEQAIRSFEPRLLARTVKVEILPNDDVADFSVKLRIEAILYVEPISELVTFDSSADFEGGGIRIESFR